MFFRTRTSDLHVFQTNFARAARNCQLALPFDNRQKIIDAEKKGLRDKISKELKDHGNKGKNPELITQRKAFVDKAGEALSNYCKYLDLLFRGGVKPAIFNQTGPEAPISLIRDKYMEKSDPKGRRNEVIPLLNALGFKQEAESRRGLFAALDNFRNIIENINKMA